MDQRITLTLASRRASAIKAIQGFLSQRMGPGEPEERQSWIHDALGSFSATKRPLKAFQHIFAAKSSLGKYELLALNAEPVQNEDIYLRADVFRVSELYQANRADPKRLGTSRAWRSLAKAAARMAYTGLGMSQESQRHRLQKR